MTLLFQSIFTAIVLFIIYLFLGPARFVEADMINEFFYLFLIPICLIGVSILFCLLVGLPIRIIPSINKWWKARQFLPILLFVFGLIILSITLQRDFTEPISETITQQKTSYNVNSNWLQIFAWALTAFSLLHFYPKNILKRKLTNDSQK